MFLDMMSIACDCAFKTRLAIIGDFSVNSLGLMLILDMIVEMYSELNYINTLVIFLFLRRCNLPAQQAGDIERTADWDLEAKAFSGPLINFVDDLSHVLIAEIINVFSFWDVLPDQTISVFVEAPLLGIIGVRKEALGSQLAGDLFMVSCRRLG